MTRCNPRPRLLILSILAVSIGFALQGALAAEHTLMPSPQTVHIVNFNAAYKPVLTIDSGDTVVIETALAIDPAEVDRSGVVPPSAVPEYTRAIYREVRDRGPGPHILTGPVFVNGAMPGDVLEVRILEIDLAVDYGFNRQRPYTGALPDEFPGFFQRIIPIDRTGQDRRGRAGRGGSGGPPVLRHHGGRAAARHGPHQLSGRRASTPATSTTRTWRPARRSTCRSTRRARCSRSATPTRPRARARSISPPSRPVCAAGSSSSCART